LLARLTWTSKTLAIAVAATIAVTAGVVSYVTNAWPRVENDSIDLRFGLRAPEKPSDVVVVAIDDKTFSDLQLQWPFARTKHAELINQLRADGARTIVYDVQFTEPTDPRDDHALYQAIGRAGRVVLATSEVDAAGHTNVLGGDANLKQVHAIAAASNLPADAGGVIRRYSYSLLGLDGLAVAAAQADGHPVSSARFSNGSALIDYRGGPETIRTISFSDVLKRNVDPRTFTGKIVVVGVSAPTLQDVHPTSTASTNPMAGPEIQANAIWTALHQNPLQGAPSWLALIAIVFAGALVPLASLRFRVLTCALIAFAIAGAYVAGAQLAFESGRVLSLTYPLAGLFIGTIGMVTANYVGTFVERNTVSHQLQESQLELIQRLAQAVESRDTETGEHIRRLGILCQRLALATGFSPAQAEMLRHASTMHDIGKIGVPDRVLFKSGPLDAKEWEIIRAHTTKGAEILAGSANPLVQMAESVALTHHEHWDGSGYPAGLKGEEIPLVGRICAICDVFDALLSKRSYKDPWPINQALAAIKHGSATHFDPHLVTAFLTLGPRLVDELGLTPTNNKPTSATQKVLT
jgi:CHASE2 domain-containing sensor protein